MFKPLPADPALIQKLRIRNRVASLMTFALLIFWPAINSYIGSTVRLGLLAPADIAVVSLFLGFGVAALLIPASVFFFGHAMRYRNLLRYLSQSPPVYPATNPADSDLKKLRTKKTMAIVWHVVTLVAPAVFVAAGIASSGDKMAVIYLMFVGSLLLMFSLTGGLALSVASINGYLSLKAKLRWAFPDAQSWSPASTSKTS